MVTILGQAHTVYCKFCALGFTKSKVPAKTELVRAKFTQHGKSAIDNLKIHERRDYHNQAVEDAERWL